MAGEDIPYEAFPIARIKFFFDDEGPDGPWMRWLYDLARPDGTVYFDNLNNLEIYGSYNFYKNINKDLDRYAGGRHGAFVNVQYEPGMFSKLLDKRRCVYQVSMHPTSDDLSAMYHSMNADCEHINSVISANDIFDGVNVSIVQSGSGSSDVKKFLKYTPNSGSVWMAWGGTTDQVPHIYHDSDNNVEVYSTYGAEVSEIPHAGSDAIYVQISDLIESLWVRVARARLYKKTNDLHATQEQLDDMVKLIEKNPPGPDLKTWGDNLYKREAKADKEGWTFRPKSGLVPLKSQFYFNPKPLKKGDQSEYENGTRMDHTTLTGLAESSKWVKSWS